MPSTHNTPLYACFSSNNSHPTQYQSSKNNKHPKQRTASLNPSLRLRGLAQAKRARSDESSLRLGEGSMEHSGNITGSRLSEIPLAWARCSLAQEFKQVAWATFRAIAQGELPVSSRLGEIDSLGRDLQVSPLFFTVTTMYIKSTKHNKHLITPTRRIHP
ncbi:hypothetical protein DEO72_LG6g2271 [Vigna unguiculata]|uniref:Uncharacterized protein n=1 Tax=Vigna unguiculata TaxID=3917 RepID=A0A4D6MAX4_VIGUN|nr:hypothetical protein DEO72_LG6g2271 [Vigna unguiculata]